MRKIVSLFTLFCLIVTSLYPGHVQAAELPVLPQPGSMVNLSPSYEPVLIKGLTVHKDNPFLFDFVVDTGHSPLTVNDPNLKNDADRLIKYFFACLTIPEKDLWVNLSPYEKNKMVPEALGQTALGRDLLAEDYILKQLTASLIYPEKDLGKEFWNKVYAKAQQMYGTTQIPINTFNKVWILADKATVYEHGQTAFVVGGHLKVMLEEDYEALQKQLPLTSSLKKEGEGAKVAESPLFDKEGIKGSSKDVANLGSKIIRDIILPAIETEVNTGKNFATLRQIFNSLILATWYKKNLKAALLNQVYADKSTIKGIGMDDVGVGSKPTQERAGLEPAPTKYTPQEIYNLYLQAYKKGVFNYIKEEPSADGQIIPRKYFSGGFGVNSDMLNVTSDAAMARPAANPTGKLIDCAVAVNTYEEKVYTNKDFAMKTYLHAAKIPGVPFFRYQRPDGTKVAFHIGKDQRKNDQIINNEYFQGALFNNINIDDLSDVNAYQEKSEMVFKKIELNVKEKVFFRNLIEFLRTELKASDGRYTKREVKVVKVLFGFNGKTYVFDQNDHKVMKPIEALITLIVGENEQGIPEAFHLGDKIAAIESSKNAAMSSQTKPIHQFDSAKKHSGVRGIKFSTVASAAGSFIQGISMPSFNTAGIPILALQERLLYEPLMQFIDKPFVFGKTATERNQQGAVERKDLKEYFQENLPGWNITVANMYPVELSDLGGTLIQKFSNPVRIIKNEDDEWRFENITMENDELKKQLDESIKSERVRDGVRGYIIELKEEKSGQRITLCVLNFVNETIVYETDPAMSQLEGDDRIVPRIQEMLGQNKLIKYDQDSQELIGKVNVVETIRNIESNFPIRYKTKVDVKAQIEKPSRASSDDTSVVILSADKHTTIGDFTRNSTLLEYEMYFKIDYIDEKGRSRTIYIAVGLKPSENRGRFLGTPAQRLIGESLRSTIEGSINDFTVDLSHKAYKLGWKTKFFPFLQSRERVEKIIGSGKMKNPIKIDLQGGEAQGISLVNVEEMKAALSPFKVVWIIPLHFRKEKSSSESYLVIKIPNTRSFFVSKIDTAMTTPATKERHSDSAMVVGISVGRDVITFLMGEDSERTVERIPTDIVRNVIEKFNMSSMNALIRQGPSSEERLIELKDIQLSTWWEKRVLFLLLERFGSVNLIREQRDSYRVLKGELWQIMMLELELNRIKNSIIKLNTRILSGKKILYLGSPNKDSSQEEDPRTGLEGLLEEFEETGEINDSVLLDGDEADDFFIGVLERPTEEPPDTNFTKLSDAISSLNIRGVQLVVVPNEAALKKELLSGSGFDAVIIEDAFVLGPTNRPEKTSMRDRMQELNSNVPILIWDLKNVSFLMMRKSGDRILKNGMDPFEVIETIALSIDPNRVAKHFNSTRGTVSPELVLIQGVIFKIHSLDYPGFEEQLAREMNALDIKGVQEIVLPDQQVNWGEIKNRLLNREEFSSSIEFSADGTLRTLNKDSPEVVKLVGEFDQKTPRKVVFISLDDEAKIFQEFVILQAPNGKIYIFSQADSAMASKEEKPGSLKKKTDAAMTPGGIDLNSTNMGMTVQKDAQGGVKVDFDPAVIERIQREGLSSVEPVIIQMTPISDIRPLLGLN